MFVETFLNFVWLFVGVAALALLIRSELWKGTDSTWAARWRSVASILLVIVFLFPCVSASDDVLSFHDLQFTLETRGELGGPLTHRSNQDKPNAHLARFFEALQSFQIQAHHSLPLLLFFFGFVVLLSRLLSERQVLSASGRAPPAAVLAV